MTAILDALEALNRSLDSLEAAAIVALEREKALGRKAKAGNTSQHDLFSAPAQKKQVSSAAAKKLDVMIERVEKILAEG